MNKGLYSSKSSEWATPRSLFLDIQYEFGLEVDVCATHENTQLPSYFTREQDGLAHDWTGLRCWMNPPYGREIGKWVEKAATGGLQLWWPYFPHAPTQNGSTITSTGRQKSGSSREESTSTTRDQPPFLAW